MIFSSSLSALPQILVRSVPPLSKRGAGVRASSKRRWRRPSLGRHGRRRISGRRDAGRPARSGALELRHQTGGRRPAGLSPAADGAARRQKRRSCDWWRQKWRRYGHCRQTRRGDTTTDGGESWRSAAPAQNPWVGGWGEWGGGVSERGWVGGTWWV